MNTERQESSGERQTYVLLTDIHRSTTLWERYPYEFSDALEKHNAIVEQAVEAHGGEIMKNLGDGYIALFRSAPACVATMVDVKRGIGTLPALPDGTQVRVRMVAHGGMLQRLAAGRGYFGEPLNRASRICQICHPGQVLMSEVVRKRLGKPPDGAELVDLGLHHLRDLSEPEHLFQLVHPDFQVQEFPPLPTLSFRPNNLVAQPNSFVGREKELADLKALLRGGKHRLITITSPGGYGKSRLAVQLLADVLDDYPNGVFQVLLAPVGGESGILGATADAIRFQFYGRGDPERQLMDYLREKVMLVCFDNFEHLTSGAPFITGVLAKAPGVKILITSREPLHLSGEKVYRLDPLPVTGDGETSAEISDAAKLFIDRASLVKQRLDLKEKSLAFVQAICEKLEGVPLSIELAAAWADAFTLPELLSEVEQRLELTARLTDVAERHRSVSASLDWSYSLLSDEQRGILRGVATFKGGFYPEAAKAVISAKSLRQRLAELCDKGWLYSREVAAKTRFFIRDAASHEYAFEKLKESDDFEPAVIAHCRYFCNLTVEQCGRLHRRGWRDAAAVMTLELENVYEALDTGLNRSDPALILPIVKHLFKYLAMRSEWEKGLRHYQDAAKWAERNGQPAVLMWALIGSGRFLFRVARYEEAIGILLKAERLAKEAGDRLAVGSALNNLGNAAWGAGKHADARLYFTDAMAIFRELDDPQGVAFALNGLGAVETGSGNQEGARSYFTECAKLFREMGDESNLAGAINNLGTVERGDGNYADARRLFTESLAIWQESGNRSGVAAVLANLGDLSCKESNLAVARDFFTESLSVGREVGDRAGVVYALDGLGQVEHRLGDLAKARELLGQAHALSCEIGHQFEAAATIVDLGNLAVHMRDYEEARRCLTQGLKEAREVGGVAVELHALPGCAAVLGAVGNVRDAALIRFGALHVGHDFGDPFEAIDSRLLAETGEALDDACASGKLGKDELDETRRKAESMTLDDLVEHALRALSELQLEARV